MCENCEHELATVYCHADAALLCTRCDGEVHRSKLASRHHRISLENVKKTFTFLHLSRIIRVLNASLLVERIPRRRRNSSVRLVIY